MPRKEGSKVKSVSSIWVSFSPTDLHSPLPCIAEESDFIDYILRFFFFNIFFKSLLIILLVSCILT